MGRLDSRSDAELLAASAREPDAFAVFYRRYVDAAFAFFMNRTRDPELAADLTAETFAAALRGSRGYRATAPNAAPWLFKIAGNKLRDSLRRGRVEEKARRSLGMQPLEIEGADFDEVLERLDFEAHERWLEDMLASLPAADRDAILAHVVHDRGYAEIAESVECSQSVIRQRVSRGLGRLRAQLSEEP